MLEHLHFVPLLVGCGIFGWFFSRPVRETTALGAVLEVLMDERGRDSWGYYAFPGPVGPIHGLGNFSEGCPSRSLRKHTMVMAHCRSASVGAITEANSHPFHIGNVIGAHNGGISNWQDLNKEYGRKFEVDSQHIFAHLDEKKTMRDIYGWGAFTAINIKENANRIHLTRWNGGDLAVARVFFKSGQRLGIAWASTDYALEAALYAAGLEHKLYEVKPEKAYFIEPDEDGVPDYYSIKDGDYHFPGRLAPLFPKARSTNTDDVISRFDEQYMYCARCGVHGPAKEHHHDNEPLALPERAQNLRAVLKAKREDREAKEAVKEAEATLADKMLEKPDADASTDANCALCYDRKVPKIRVDGMWFCKVPCVKEWAQIKRDREGGLAQIEAIYIAGAIN